MVSITLFLRSFSFLMMVMVADMVLFKLLEGGEDYGHQMTTQGITILPSILEEGEMGNMQHLGTDLQQQQPVSQEDIRIKKEQERANCFGLMMMKIPIKL